MAGACLVIVVCKVGLHVSLESEDMPSCELGGHSEQSADKAVETAAYERLMPSWCLILQRLRISLLKTPILLSSGVRVV